MRHKTEQQARMQNSRKRKASITPPIIDGNLQEFRSRKGIISKTAKQRNYRLKHMRLGTMQVKPDTEVLARIRTRIRSKAEQETEINKADDLKDDKAPQIHIKRNANDENAEVPEASIRQAKLPHVQQNVGTHNKQVQEDGKANRLDYRNLIKAASGNDARKLLKDKLQGLIIQQTSTSTKRRKVDGHSIPLPYNSKGDHHVEGQGELTRDQDDRMHAIRIQGRDLHEHRVIARLIGRSSG